MFRKVFLRSCATNKAVFCGHSIKRTSHVYTNYFYLNHKHFSITTLTMSNDGNDEKLFKSLGLKDSTLKNIKNNENTANALRECINEANITNGCDSDIGKLIFEIATAKQMTNDNAKKNRHILLKYVVNRKIKTVIQLTAAYKYLSKTANFNVSDFEKACGVGVVVTTEQIIQTIDEIIDKYKDELPIKGKGCLGRMYAEMKAKLPWADGKEMSKIFKEKFDAALKASGFNPKTAKKQKKKTESKQNNDDDNDDEEEETMEKWLTGRELEVAKNTKDQLLSREKGLNELKLSKNVFLSRFPPEPNGFLHIGHCKAMTFNFTLADKQSGCCYLRFDDTNPTTEKQVYIDNIIENVEWMGFKPWKVTYSSQYFDDLYALALKMIGDGNAYVCHQSGEQIEAERKTFRQKKPVPSPYRDRSVEENLRLFELMRCGYFGEGEAVLRMKGDYLSPNPNMWDHIAYRIMYDAHPMSGDKWCIYPTYDYTHCIVDSLEWITASCCTLEFENRRESYFWLLDVLNLYKPIVWEYSRLNITFNVLSKRKLLILVNEGYVNGWDDPRMLTINGLRRRGYTPTILRDFCNKVGVTRNDNFVSPVLLQYCAKNELNQTCSRAMAVFKPLKIILTNYDDQKEEDIECPNFPQIKDSAVHTVKFCKIVYIDADDFKMGQLHNKRFYGLTEGKTVRLKYAYNIKCTKVVFEDDKLKKKIKHLECEYDPDHNSNVKKGHLTWVCNGVEAEFRLYDHLFKVEKPGGNDWLKQLNEKSEVVHKGLVDKYVLNTFNKKKRFQFERFGYFVKDSDSDKCGYPVFNRTVALNEGNKKIKKKGKAKKNKK